MRVGYDKFLHAIVSAVATIAIGLPLFFIGWSSILCGGLFSLGLGLGKEYGDSKAPGNKWDWFDILADVIGIAVGVGTLLCLYFGVER